MPTAVSLFSGCGGFCEGMKLANFHILCGVEKDRYAAETYRFNFPEVPLFDRDIHNFLAPEPQQHIEEYSLDHVDVVFGGPPCQGYSQIGTRKMDDERNNLYTEFARVVSILQPSVFLMENVPNVLSLNKGHYKQLILAAFREAGYERCTPVTVVASDFGVPQDRRRVFFIGLHDRLCFPYNLQQFLQHMLGFLKVRHPVTVWEAIGDLPENVVDSGEITPYPPEHHSEFQEIMRLDCDREPYPQTLKMQGGIRHLESIALHNHHTKEIQERRLALIELLEPGKKANTLPKEVWNGLRPEKWRRLHPDLPAYTLLANMHRDLSEFVHPRLNRWITVREAARLQSFHDGFIFVGSEWQQLKQVGNAVPPLMGRVMGIVATTLINEATKQVTNEADTHLMRNLYVQEALPLF